MNAFGKYENCEKPHPLPLKTSLITIAALRNNCRNVQQVAEILKKYDLSFDNYKI